MRGRERQSSRCTTAGEPDCREGHDPGPYASGQDGAYLSLCRVVTSGRERGRSESRSPDRSPQSGRAEAHSRGHRENRHRALDRVDRMIRPKDLSKIRQRKGDYGGRNTTGLKSSEGKKGRRKKRTALKQGRQEAARRGGVDGAYGKPRRILIAVASPREFDLNRSKMRAGIRYFVPQHSRRPNPHLLLPHPFREMCYILSVVFRER